MNRGILNCTHLGNTHAMKPRVGKNAASRRRLGRCVSKARRRALRSMVWAEQQWVLQS